MDTVFVYGSLLSGYHNHTHLGGATFLGDGKTAEAAFTMHDMGLFPGVTRSGTAQIVGELYRIDDAILRCIDRLEGHPHFYKRVLKMIDTADGKVQAWVYLLPSISTATYPKSVPGGDWKAARPDLMTLRELTKKFEAARMMNSRPY